MNSSRTSQNNQTTYQKEHHNETDPNFKTSRAAALHLRTYCLGTHRRHARRLITGWHVCHVYLSAIFMTSKRCNSNNSYVLTWTQRGRSVALTLNL